jgi:hypothetical protein
VSGPCALRRTMLGHIRQEKEPEKRVWEIPQSPWSPLWWIGLPSRKPEGSSGACALRPEVAGGVT